MPESVYKNYL